MKFLMLYIGLALLLTTSCKKFLVEEPKDEIANNQYFTQPEHAVNAVNALYRAGAPQLYDATGGVYSGSKMMFGPYLSGYIDNEYKGQEVHVQHAQNMTFNAVNLSSYFQGTWSSLYLGIARANNAIKYIPLTPGLAETDAKRLMAEAKFFRAFGYFELARMFGGVPLITEPYESINNLNQVRASLDEVYKLIVSDLEYAVGEGVLADKPMVNNNGRISRFNAASLLAEVYLTMSGYPLQKNEYANAAKMAKIVTSSGNFQLTAHGLNEDGTVAMSNTAYNKLRLTDKSATEYIYYYEFTVGIASSTYAAWAFPATAASETAYAVTTNAYGLTPKFLQGYDRQQDLRIQEKQFFHSSMIRKNGATLNFATAPYMWQDDEATFQTASSGKDFPIYTYADVLLNGAESIALSEGVTAEAVNYLTQVRSRAYWKTDAGLIRQELSKLSVADFVKEVWKERYRELVFEGRIWYDIQRTRTFPVPAANGSGNILFEPVAGHLNNNGAVIQEKNLLLPIPAEELQRNPLLVQNPGY